MWFHKSKFDRYYAKRCISVHFYEKYLPTNTWSTVYQCRQALVLIIKRGACTSKNMVRWEGIFQLRKNAVGFPLVWHAEKTKIEPFGKICIQKGNFCHRKLFISHSINVVMKYIVPGSLEAKSKTNQDSFGNPSFFPIHCVDEGRVIAAAQLMCYFQLEPEQVRATYV